MDCLTSKKIDVAGTAMFHSHLICTLSFCYWASLSLLTHFWYHRPLVSPYSVGPALLSFLCALLFLPLKSIQSFGLGPPLSTLTLSLGELSVGLQ